MNNNNNSPAAAATEYNSVYTNSCAVNDVQQQNAAQTQAAAVGQTTTTTNIAAAAASLANNSSQGNVVDSTIIINMDHSSAGTTNSLNNMQQPTIGGSSITNSNNEQSSAMQRNFLPFLNEARARLGRQTSYPGSILNQTWHGGNRSQFDLHRTRTTLQMPEYNIPTNAPVSPSSPPPPVAVPAHLRQLRAWRMNINNMLTFSTAPSTETLRSLITHTRYVRGQGQRGGPDDNINLLLQDGNDHNGDPAAIDASSTTGGDRINGRTLRSFSDLGGASTSRQMLTPNSRLTNASNPELNRHIDDNELNATANTTPPPNNNNNSNNNSTNDDGVPVFDEDVISNAVVTILSHVVRYLPFIFILCLKFLYDHMEGILDLVFLHLIMHHMNKSLRKQVAKLSQKSYTIIFRDMTLILLVVIYRLIITTTPPDPFGLLITPPIVTTTVTVKLGPAVLGDTPVVGTQTTPAPKVASNIIEGLPLGLLLYYVAINDLVLKLLTILVKNIIVLMPTRIIRHKQRSRLYVILEYTSQLYRAMVPIHEWIKFLYESYTGLEVISGILFSTFYMCSKGFEFVHRGQPLKKAIMIFVRNLDSQRRPTVSELGSAGGVCPICHDNYDTPVVLECNHIFCDACVNTWFKREQTCPMCRAKINIDPNWEDGATTYFYQLC